VLLSAGADVEARDQVSAVRDESDLSVGTMDSAALCLPRRPCEGGLCVVVIWGCGWGSK
jgi:hypothetical protein